MGTTIPRYCVHTFPVLTHSDSYAKQQGGQTVIANLAIRCEVEDNGDGTYSVSYVPSADPHQQMFLDISLDGRPLGGMALFHILKGRTLT